jgi:phosphopantothenoylcysteine decarboxylase / phosphopantothenate---cysteine ligase
MSKKREIKKILITAGPTRESLDPVRFLSNRSTGKIGYELAREAERKGHEVTLISGPVAQKAPKNVAVQYIETAEEMLNAVKKSIKGKDMIIMSAAVSDFKPAKVLSNKIKKNSAGSLELKPTKDILKEILQEKGIIKVGFALETEELKKNSIKKMREKGLDLLIGNTISDTNNPFGEGQKTYHVFRGGKETGEIIGKIKEDAAKEIFKEAEKLLYKNEK